jgi:predicted DNA-binding transcriptional regulator AlpA
MKKQTLKVIEEVLKNDGSVSPAERKRLVGEVAIGTDGDNFPDRILRRAEVARLLGRSIKTIDRLASRGCLGKVTFPGYRRAAGFRMSDIERLVGRGAE